MIAQITRTLRSFEDRLNLRQQLGLTMGVLTFLIVATLAVGASWVGEREARKTTTEGLAGLASTLSDRLERNISLRMSMLEVLARIEPLRPIWAGDPAAVRNVLDQSLAVISGGSWLGFANTDALVTAAAGGRREGESVLDQQWFQHGLFGTAVVDVDASQHSLTGLAPDGRPYAIAEIAVPVRNGTAEPAGVLALSLNWLWAASLRQETLNRSTQAETKELWVLSRDGLVIVGPDIGVKPYSDEVFSWIRSTGQGSFSDDAKKSPVLTGFATLDEHPTLGWIVIARQPEAIAFLPAQRVVAIIVILGALTGAVGILASVLVAVRISRPITRLASEADLIERDSVGMLSREGGSREVVRLSSALRSLVLRLGSAEERTVEAELRAVDVETRLGNDIAALRSLADTDLLTQLLNRRRFLDFANDAMQQFSEHGRPFAIMMVDIDRFKSVNDALGHPAGDRVIHWVASKIAAGLRPNDTAARFGGEEFIALVAGISLSAASDLAERIRRSIAVEPIAVAGSDLFVTVSIGVAVAEESDRDVEDLIQRADLALYRAKNKGRNAVELAPERDLGPARRVA